VDEATAPDGADVDPNSDDPRPDDPDQGDPRPDDPGEVARLRRERDELRQRVAALEEHEQHEQPDGRRPPRRVGARVRHGAVVVLVVLGVASFTASAVGWWARRNVADTDVWVQRTATLAEDPAVQAAISAWLGDQVVELIDPRELFLEVLPERGQLLAGPLSGAVEDFVRDRVADFVASDRFAQLWVAATERAHTAVVRVLRGESEVVDAQGNRVVIDLVPAIDTVLGEIAASSPDLFGRQIDLPEVSVDDVPEVAIRRLERALGVDLGDDFGQFVVYDRGRLQALQDGLERARRWLVGLSVLTVVVLAAALWFSDRRRRTLLQVVAGLALGLALIRRLGLRGQRELLAAISDATNRGAVEAVSDRFLEPLLAVTRNLLWALVAIAVVALVSGPYPWAVRLRGGVADLARGGASGDVPARAVTWLRDHAAAVRAGGLAAVLLVLLVVDVSFAGLVVLGGLVALGALALREPEEHAGAEQPG
jgi:hypothetical protein